MISQGFLITLVTKAVQEHNIEAAKLLIGKGADVNARAPEGYGPLEMSDAKHGDGAMVRTLLEAGVSVNGPPESKLFPLFLAARHGNVAVLQEFLKNNQLDINKQDFQRRTAFHMLIASINNLIIGRRIMKKYPLFWK